MMIRLVKLVLVYEINLGTGLELQHIRKKQLSTCELNEELPPVDKNLQYDFDYQQANHLPEVITLLPVRNIKHFIL